MDFVIANIMATATRGMYIKSKREISWTKRGLFCLVWKSLVSKTGGILKVPVNKKPTLIMIMAKDMAKKRVPITFGFGSFLK